MTKVFMLVIDDGEIPIITTSEIREALRDAGISVVTAVLISSEDGN